MLLHENFFLTTKAAQRLYHDHASHQPIFDYHCHLPPEEIAGDKRFADITEVWLGGDHYKWRLMRLSGIEEKYIMGDAAPQEKFLRYAKILPNAIGNPVHHWSHLELQRFFHIHTEINAENAASLWEQCNAQIQAPEFSARQLMQRANVDTICTGDDPIDTLEHHQAIAADTTFNIQVFPTFRPDKALAINKGGFANYIQKLASISGIQINTYQDVCEALIARIAFFHAQGGRMSDHGLDIMPYATTTLATLDSIFTKGMACEALSELETEQYQTHLLLTLGREYARLRWTMQMHIGALRSVNTRMLATQGRDCGYDASSDRPCLDKLACFLNHLDQDKQLPHVILFSLNPTLDSALATMAGNFPGDADTVKVQLGPAWWHNDHKAGMINQLVSYANASVLGHFIGMTTDSRSFLSYPRHEYFRRILCGLLGDWVELGECSEKTAIQVVEQICFRNAKQQFYRE